MDPKDRIATTLGVVQVLGNFLSDEELNALFDGIFADLNITRPYPANNVVPIAGGDAA